VVKLDSYLDDFYLGVLQGVVDELFSKVERLRSHAIHDRHIEEHLEVHVISDSIKCVNFG
jgi:hypothetical protein